MLIDKRSILKEAQAKAAAKNVPAAGGNNRMATKKTSAKAEKAAETVVAAAKEKAAEAVVAAEEIKAAAEKTAKEVKKAAVKKADEVKTAAKKRTVKKAAEPKCTVTIEFAGKSIAAKETLDRAIKAFKDAHKDVEVKTVDLYIKPETGEAFYVVNGEGSADFRIEL